jgi:hypothetical protein
MDLSPRMNLKTWTPPLEVIAPTVVLARVLPNAEPGVRVRGLAAVGAVILVPVLAPVVLEVVRVAALMLVQAAAAVAVAAVVVVVTVIVAVAARPIVAADVY